MRFSEDAGAERRPLPALVLATAAAGVVAAGAVAAGALAVVTGPPVGTFRSAIRRNELAARTRPIPAGKVPSVLEHAVVAAEDEHFYRDHGIDVLGVLRSTVYDVTHLTAAQGGSTITEQLVKNLYFDGSDHSPWRKLQDALAALQLELRASKRGILAAYLNTSYFGDHAFGVRAAARRYFSCPPQRLGLARSSLLAGLLQAPSAYDPFHDPRGARLRQRYVLAAMTRNHFTTAERARRVLGRPQPLTNGLRLPPTGWNAAEVRPGLPAGLYAAAITLLCGAITTSFALRRRIGRTPALVAGGVSALALFLVARSLPPF